MIFKNLNDSFIDKIFDDIYLPSAERSDSFNVQVDIRLKNWIDNVLPSQTVEVGWKVLSEQFLEILNKKDENCQETKNSENDYNLFKNLKAAVADDVLEHHTWDPKAYDVLVLKKLYFLFKLFNARFLIFVETNPVERIRRSNDLRKENVERIGSIFAGNPYQSD